jgi:hypothetical protein
MKPEALELDPIVEWELIKRRGVLEDEEGWYEWAKKMPRLSFPPEWMVRILPPLSGAIARFVVTHGVLGANYQVSAYADVHNRLGSEPLPYWEIYPYDGDVWRCPLEHGRELIDGIHRAFEYMIEEHEKED